ncbi:MAG: hypothetical protein RLZZ12_856 [Actinomycetota bacterium]|jgi:hypothetical protein
MNRKHLKPLLIASSLSFALTLSNALPAKSNTEQFAITELSRIVSGDGEGGAEIPTFHAGSKRLFATNGARNSIDVYDLSDPTKPVRINRIELKSYGSDVTSVAAGRDVVVAAVHRAETFSANGVPSTPSGVLVVMNTDGKVIATPDLEGVLPDAVSFTPSGTIALVAIEGQPVCAKDDPSTTSNESTDYSKAADPLGGVSIVDLTDPVNPEVNFVDFKGLTVSELRAKGLALSSVVNDAAKDLEPEYVVALDESKAYVTIQEANGLGVLDIENGAWIEIRRAFESKLTTTPIDTSDRDSGRGPRSYVNVVGASQPDAIAGFKIGSGHYLITANEGDAREYSCLNDDLRASSLKVDSRRFPNWKAWSSNAELGRAKVNPNAGDRDGDGDIDTIHLRGARSMTMYRNGIPIWDSGKLLEQIQIGAFGEANINGSHALSSDRTTVNYTAQDRSDDKGAEPEGVAVGMVGNSRIAVLGLERMSALVVFDISIPREPTVVKWIQMLPTAATPVAQATAWSPEGVIFIPADKSPNGKSLFVTSYELSGSLTVHQIEETN